ncbi:histidine phosphatase family protein [Nesterenkonia salmonea]|uniref:histidine phosphatase family protein n=1 Tax=Nesterenkonia salmonea TaxID=1804987 RepID=UPI00140BA440|nr:histidine phosphatase family protein [Nesterenkonia salmonea]
MICVRHGETEWNRAHRLQGQSEVALADSGIRQAQAAGLYVRGQQPAAGYVSPLTRTHATFAQFRLGFEPVEEPRLIEQSLGTWEGMETAAAKTEYAAEYAAWKKGTGTPPGGEDPSAVVDRMRAAFFSIVRRAAEISPTPSVDTDYDLRTVVIVSHGTSTKALLEGLGLIDRSQVISLSAAAISVVDVPLHGGPLSSSLPKGGTQIHGGPEEEARVIRQLSDEQIETYAKLRMYNLSPEILDAARSESQVR